MNTWAFFRTEQRVYSSVVIFHYLFDQFRVCKSAHIAQWFLLALYFGCYLVHYFIICIIYYYNKHWLVCIWHAKFFEGFCDLKKQTIQKITFTSKLSAIFPKLQLLDIKMFMPDSQGRNLISYWQVLANLAGNMEETTNIFLKSSSNQHEAKWL